MSALLVFAGLCEAPGEEPIQPIKEIKVLVIGNSFTGDATSFLPEFAQGGGKKMTLFVAAVGGYTLEEHAARLQAHEAEPQDPKGRPYGKKTYSLREALQKEDWNVVTVQQSSVRSMRPETFQPSLDILIASIRQHAPRARILLFETWAYPEDYYDQVENLKLDRASMREKIKSAYREVSEKIGLAIIPVGEAFERMADLAPPVTLIIPNDKHCNSRGQYLSGAVLYEVISGESVENNAFRPPDLPTAEVEALLRVAHETVSASFQGRTGAASKE